MSGWVNISVASRGFINNNNISEENEDRRREGEG